MRYKADPQDGNPRYFKTLDHARAYAYRIFQKPMRSMPVIIYAPSGKMSGIVMWNAYGYLIWRTFSDKNGSYDRLLYEDGRAQPKW